ncbi:hypothetical protein BDV59DRAFT_205007 [Aspergillus ambiguus]|uniref:uncharacterized protein n=1 Tax=Aspergillus ambiguus TaxID=176160 RepID=UPI003CCCC081
MNAFPVLLIFHLLTTIYASTTHYNVTLPENSIILESEAALKDLTKIIAYSADALSQDLDARMASARLFDRLLQKKDLTENRLRNIFACSHPRCVYPGIPGKCVHYTDCHFCAHTRRCI